MCPVCLTTAALLAVSVILLAMLRVKPLNIIEKAALYITTAVLVYLDSAVLPEHRLFSYRELVRGPYNRRSP